MCRAGKFAWRHDVVAQRTLSNASTLWQRYVSKTRGEVVSPHLKATASRTESGIDSIWYLLISLCYREMLRLHSAC